jgi:hypothetical protein
MRRHLIRCTSPIAILLLHVITFATSASAQNVKDELDALATKVSTARATATSRQQIKEVLTSGTNFGQFMILVGAGPDAGALLAEIEDSRTDEQLGAGPGATGTTSLVTKGGIPSVLALAVENGALTQSASGTVVTFRGTPVGVISALAGKGYLQLLPDEDPVVKALSGLSFSASFDTSRGITASGTPALTADRKQLSQWTARWVAVNHRNPARLGYAPLWEEVGSALAQIAGGIASLRMTMMNDAAFDAWLDNLAQDLSESDPTDKTVARVLARHVALLAVTPSATATQARMTTGAYGAYLGARERALKKANEGLLITVEYTDDLPAVSNSISNTRFIAERGGIVDVTANAAISWFDKLSPNQERLRDTQASVQLDVPLGNPSDVGRFTLSFAGKFQWLNHDPAVPAIAAPSATIGLAQLKLTVPMKGSGVRVPVSLTWASRTEMITEKITRANVGISYDLDALFARFKP